jgi:sigma-B regulation protein RsbU (phosphoserine phosphatase)
VLPHGRVALTVGDVTGHGIGAALLMASGRAVLRSHAETDTPPATLLGFVNRHLAQDASGGKFMTCFFGVLDAGAGTLSYANAGQGGCYVYRCADDRFEELTASGPPLGVVDGIAFEERRVDGLRQGDIVVLGTDGIWEAQDTEGAFFEMERFVEVVRANASKSSQEIERAVMAAVAGFRRGAPQTDDITLVIVRVDGKAKGPT